MPHTHTPPPHLLEFERRSNRAPIPAWLQSVSSPLVRQEWAEELADHLDSAFRDYILVGITQGVHIGFDHRRYTCKPAASNMHSATENARVVQEYLDKEVTLGRVVGPVSPKAVRVGTQLSPMGVIPKSSQPGKWRLIVDLSSPEGRSVNGGIEPDLCSLQYLRLDEVIQRIAATGRGTLLAKMDIESAYRIIPVHLEDRPLLGMQWEGGIFFDTRLPFGLRSAPKIFSAMADALQWSIHRNGVSWVAHYLDDYITMGAPDSQECQANMERMLSVCQWLGVPISPSKCAGPAQVLTFLGFELDTNQMVVRLPEEKLWRTLAMVQEWAGKKRELESLLGHLQHAATVVRPGRTFVRRLIELLSMTQSRDRWIRLNASSRSDLRWWLQFMQGWNGVAMMPMVSLPSLVLESGHGAVELTGSPSGSSGSGEDRHPLVPGGSPAALSSLARPG